MAVRQLIIALDAMEWTLVRQLAAEGKLPAMRQLMDEGAAGELATNAAQLPDSAWHSVFTGRNPADFEKYFYVQYDAATQGLRYVPDTAVTAAPVWRVLSERGVKVGVADLPHFPADPMNGFHIANWGAHATNVPKETFPAELGRKIEDRFGRHPVSDCDKVDDRPGALLDLKDRILQGVQAHGELFRWLMKTQRWDVFFACFSAPHCAGHFFWDSFRDETQTGGSLSQSLSGTIEQVYCAVDRELGQMIRTAGDDVRVLVTACHGMGPIVHASWNLPEILELLGYGKEAGAHRAASRSRKAAVNPWRVLKMVLPGRLQYAIRNALPLVLRNKLLFLWYAGARDWNGCRAFPVPNNEQVGAIRIAVRGRDLHGVVEPGAEYEAACRDLAEAFRELTDPRTGRPVVRQVGVPHQLFSGPFLDGLPDITVLWEQDFAWDELHSPRFGTLKIPRQDARRGSHAPHAFVLMRGPGIEHGVMKGHSIYDIAPTILEGAGVPAPEGLRGRSIATQHSVRQAAPAFMPGTRGE